MAVVGDVNDGDDGGDSVVVILWWRFCGGYH